MAARTSTPLSWYDPLPVHEVRHLCCLEAADIRNRSQGWLARQAEAQGIAVRKNKAAMRRLREAAEAAKIRLSVMKSVTVEVSGAEEGQVQQFARRMSLPP